MATLERTGVTDEAEIRRTLEEEGWFNIFRWCDAAGTRYAEHTHPYHEVRWILSGHLQIVENGVTLDLLPGDRMESEANVPHSAYMPENVCYICGSKES